MPGFSAGTAYADIVPRLQRGWSSKIDRDLDGPLSRIRSRVGAIGKTIATGLAVGVAGGAAAAVVGIKGAVDAASDLNEATNVTGLIFKDARGEIDAFVRDSFKLGLSETKARELTGSVGGLLQNMGLTREESVKWSKDLTTLGADLGSAFNANPEDAVQALGAALRGETEPARRFNIVLSEAAIQAEALRLGLVKGAVDTTKVATARVALEKATWKAKEAEKEYGADSFQAREAAAKQAAAEDALTKALAGTKGELTKAAKTQATLSLITAQSAAVQGDFANTSDGVANSQRIAAARMENIKAKIGQVFLPAWTSVLGVVNDRVLPALERHLPSAIESVKKTLAPVGKFLGDVADDVGMFWNTLRTGFTEDEGTGIERFALLLREQVFPIVRNVVDWLRKNWKPVLAGAALALGLLTAPISTVVALLVGAYLKFEGFRNVVDAVVRWLVQNVPPSFAAIRNAVDAVVRFFADNVAPVVARVAGWIVEKFSAVVDWFRSIWPEVSAVIGTVIDAVTKIIETFVAAVGFLWDTFGETILEVARRVWRIVAEVIEVAVDLVRGIIETALALVTGKWGKAWDAIKRTFGNVWDSIVDILGNVLGIIGELVGKGMEVTARTMRAALDGIVGFFRDLPGRLLRAAGDVFGFLWEAFKAAVNLIIKGWNALDFKIPGFSFGPIDFAGFTLGLPDIPLLARGGRAVRAGAAIVGEAGPELVQLPRGAKVVPLDNVDAARDGVAVEFGQTYVDARGIDEPEEVADLTSRVLGWRLVTALPR